MTDKKKKFEEMLEDLNLHVEAMRALFKKRFIQKALEFYFYKLFTLNLHMKFSYALFL